MYGICSKLTIQRPKRRQWSCSGVFQSFYCWLWTSKCLSGNILYSFLLPSIAAVLNMSKLQKYSEIKETVTQTQRCSVKKVFLEISRNSQENTCAGVSILITLQDSGLQPYLKRDSCTGVFLWILQNFLEYLSLHNTSDGCF